MGMKLHRKRSLLPIEPAIATFVSFAEEETVSTLLELRYQFGTQKVKFGEHGCQLVVSSADIGSSIKSVVCERGEQPGVGDDVATVEDPDGYNIMLVDELEFLKQTLL